MTNASEFNYEQAPEIPQAGKRATLSFDPRFCASFTREFCMQFKPSINSQQEPTITMDARAVDQSWTQKMCFQLTPEELVVFSSICLGYRLAHKFSGHGSGKSKSLSVEWQIRDHSGKNIPIPECASMKKLLAEYPPQGDRHYYLFINFFDHSSKHVSTRFATMPLFAPPKIFRLQALCLAQCQKHFFDVDLETVRRYVYQVGVDQPVLGDASDHAVMKHRM